MSILKDLFQVSDSTSKELYRLGICSSVMENKYQIFKHYEELIAEGISPTIAVIDCSIHFKVSSRYVFKARKEIKTIKKLLNKV